MKEALMLNGVSLNPQQLEALEKHLKPSPRHKNEIKVGLVVEP